MKNLSVAVLLASTALPVIAADADHPVSIEVLGGKASSTTSVDGIGETNDDSGSAGARLTFAFTDNLALETSYMQYGEADKTYTDYNNDEVQDNIETTSINVGLKLSAPITDYFMLSVRGGAAKWDAKAKQDIGLVTLKADDDGVDPYYGFGAEFQVADHFIIGAEYTVLDANLSEGNFDGSHKIKNTALILGYQF